MTRGFIRNKHSYHNDGVKRGLVGEVLKRIERTWFQTRKLELRSTVSEDDWPTLSRLIGKSFVLRQFMTSGPIIVGIISGPKVLESWRDMMGATQNKAFIENQAIQKVVHGSGFRRVTTRNVSLVCGIRLEETVLWMELFFVPFSVLMWHFEVIYHFLILLSIISYEKKRRKWWNQLCLLLAVAQMHLKLLWSVESFLSLREGNVYFNSHKEFLAFCAGINYFHTLGQKIVFCILQRKWSYP